MTAPAPIGIYLHVPFCEVACRYCDFYFVTRATPRIPAYVAALRREIARYAVDPRLRGRTIASIYFGGGTPSLLPVESVRAILDDARRLFPVVPGAEITLEANPGSTHDERLAGFRDAGVNRLSLGIQSFHDDELRTLWRTHTGEAAARAFDRARGAGFENINVDLMFAIPRQTFDRWRESIERAVALSPEHVSTYCLTIEPGTPIAAHIEEGRVARAAEETEREMYGLAMDALESRGWAQYEISNFARPGRASIHNLVYWNRGEYLGLGPAAHGFLAPERWSNVEDLDAYVQREDPRGMRETLDREQERMEYLWLQLRQVAGVDLDDYQARFGVDLTRDRAEAMRDLLQGGEVERVGGRVRLTREGRMVAEGVTDRLV